MEGCGAPERVLAAHPELDDAARVEVERRAGLVRAARQQRRVVGLAGRERGQQARQAPGLRLSPQQVPCWYKRPRCRAHCWLCWIGPEWSRATLVQAAAMSSALLLGWSGPE